MPRTARPRIPHVTQHVVQRGNNRARCFFSEADCAYYQAQLMTLASEHAVAIHAYVLMTNHIHLLATPATGDGLPALMKQLHQAYARYVNERYARCGTVWAGRYRAALVESGHYVLNCYRYIELNPVRVGMVQHPGHYRWSSFIANSCGPSGALEPHPCWLDLGERDGQRRENYVALFSESLSDITLDALRRAVGTSACYGSKRFVEQIRQKTADAGARTVVATDGMHAREAGAALR